jgi:hypothetical protein
MVVREAVGLAQPAPQDHVHDNELSVVPLIQLQRSAGFRPVVIERWLRGYGDSLRRIAEAEAGWWNREVEMAMVASGRTEGEMLQAQADLGSQMPPSSSRSCWLSTMASRNRPGARCSSSTSRARWRRAGLYRRLERPPARCFVDLSGDTRLTEERGDAAAEVVARLAGLVRRSAQEHDGTLVKWLGDGGMCYFRPMPCWPRWRWSRWSSARARRHA